jgi:hypothetical protein
MTGGTEFSEELKVPQEDLGAAEETRKLDAATENAEDFIEEGDFKPAEELESAFKDTLQVVEIREAVKVAELSTTPEISLEGSAQAGKITIERPAAGSDERIMEEEEPVQGKSDQSLVMEEEPIQGMVGDSHLMEEDEEPVQSRTDSSQMMEGDEEPVQGRTDGQVMEGDEEPVQGMVGDSHLMEEEEEPIQSMPGSEMMEDEEEPVQSRQVSHLMEEEESLQGKTAAELMEEKDEPVQGLTDPEIVSQLMDQLPEGAESFTSQAAADIVKTAMAGESADFLSPTRDAIQGQFQNLSPDQSEGILAVSLLKAVQSMDPGGSDLPDQPPGSDMGAQISPNYPGINPAGNTSNSDQAVGGIQTADNTPDIRISITEKIAELHQQMAEDLKIGADSVSEIYKMALQLLKEYNERQQRNIDVMSNT